MGKRGKFEKLERNQTYFDTHTAEEDNSKEEIKKAKKEEKKPILDIFNSEKVPEKLNPSGRFTYKKERRKIIYDTPKADAVTAPPKMPFVLMVSVVILVLVANIFMSGKGYMSLGYHKAAIVKMAVMAAVYILPSTVYIFSSRERTGLYNMRSFSASYLPVTALSLGLVTCLTLLQKYFITYMFSYNVSSAAPSGNTLLAVMAGALVPAICEEFFVRGILQHEISRYAGGITGILSCALVFAVLHFDLQYFTVYLAAGLVLGSLTHLTHSVFPAMIVHFLNNTVSILLSDKLTYIALWRISGTLLMIILATLCFVFLILILRQAEVISRKRAAMYLSRSKENAAKENADDSESESNHVKLVSTLGDAEYFTSPKGRTPERFGRVMLSPFMIAILVIFVVVAIVKFNS